MDGDGVSCKVNATTKFIISTSGRNSSCERYKELLEKKLKLNICYLPIHNYTDEKGKIDPQQFSWAIRGMPCIGGAISRDIKQTIIPYLDELDPVAKKINSVNTIVRKGDILKGYNTDAEGFRSAIEKSVQHKNLTSAVIYGYGGVTNVAVAVLRSFGMELYVTGRRAEMVEAKAKELGVKAWSCGIKADLFVNAAPVTDNPLSQAVGFLEALDGCQVVFDHELKGQYLVDYCNEENVKLLKGSTMYFPQMVAQWSLFLEGIVEKEKLIGALLES